MEYVMGKVYGTNLAHLVQGQLTNAHMTATLCGEMLVLSFARADVPVCHKCLAEIQPSNVNSIHNITPRGGKQWRDA